MHEEAMTTADKSHITIGDAEIDAFVKYRNDIAYGLYMVLDSTIVYTTHLMAYLVYCCVLARLVDLEKLLNNGLRMSGCFGGYSVF